MEETPQEVTAVAVRRWLLLFLLLALRFVIVNSSNTEHELHIDPDVVLRAPAGDESLDIQICRHLVEVIARRP